MTGNNRVIRINNKNVTLELSDSNPNSTHYITLTDGRGTSVSDTGTESQTCIKVSGGYITGGSADYGGGVSNYGIFTMSGGSISANNASSRGGGGVYNYGKFSISGSPTITGNFKNATKNDDGTFSGGSINNVYLTSSYTIFTVSNTLTDSAKIGVTMEKPGVFTSGLSGKGNYTIFTSDSYRYEVVDVAGEAQLEEEKHTFTYTLSGDSCLVATCSESGCSLPDSKATLTISAPVTDDGEAVLTSDPVGFFENLSVKYQSKLNGSWVDQDYPPTAEGIHKASVTYSAGEQSFTLSVSYGMNCIVYQNTDGAHGKVLGPGGKEKTGATVGAMVEPEFTPDTGYEVDVLTVTPADAGVKVTVNGNKSFIMPESTVTVSATFKKIEYAITIGSLTNGTVTAQKSGGTVSTANYQDTITLTVTPDTNYELDTLTVKDSSNNDVAVSNNTFTMPASAVTVSATFKKSNYKISSVATNGSVIIPETAQYQDNIRLVMSPDVGLGVGAITVTDGVTLNLISRDTKTGVELYELDMPAQELTVNVKFAEMTIYTIFYVARNASSVSYRFYDGDTTSLAMKSNAQLGTISVLGRSSAGCGGQEVSPDCL